MLQRVSVGRAPLRAPRTPRRGPPGRPLLRSTRSRGPLTGRSQKERRSKTSSKCGTEKREVRDEGRGEACSRDGGEGGNAETRTRRARRWMKHCEQQRRTCAGFWTRNKVCCCVHCVCNDVVRVLGVFSSSACSSVPACLLPRRKWLIITPYILQIRVPSVHDLTGG